MERREEGAQEGLESGDWESCATGRVAGFQKEEVG